MTLDPGALEFARIAEALRAAPTPHRTAEDIVDYLCEQLDADHVGITLIRDAGLETIASTDDMVAKADDWQDDLNEGPCRDGSWDRQTLTVGDLALDGRWPRWAAKVLPCGIASLLASELASHEGRRVGTLNVYWTTPHGFTADDIAFVDIFARHAALVLVESLKEADLNTDLDGRNRIGQAQGILMERYDLNPDQTFHVLRRFSQEHNIKLRQVAEDLDAERKLPTLHPAGRSPHRTSGARS